MTSSKFRKLLLNNGILISKEAAHGIINVHCADFPLNLYVKHSNIYDGWDDKICPFTLQLRHAVRHGLDFYWVTETEVTRIL